MDDRSTGGAVGRVASELKASRASRFYACGIEGGKGERELKAAKTRGRWERLAQSALMLRAERIECRDDDGATLAVVALVEEDAELVEASEPSPMDAPASSSPRADEVDRIVQIIVRAQDAALSRGAEHTSAVIEGALRIASAATERADKLERAVLALVKQRENELDAAAAAIEEQARAAARAADRAEQARRVEREEDEASSALDKMGEKLVNDHVLPAIGAKIMAGMSGATGAKPSA